MSITSWLGEFWAANSGSLIVSVVVGLVFFVLGPLGLWFSGRKVKRERLAKAQVMLIDLVESMLVNGETVSSETLHPLIDAVGREVGVALSDHYDIELLIQDVMLRFQRSKHLDAEQKAGYVDKLMVLVEQVRTTRNRASEASIPRRYQAIFNDLQGAITEGDQKSAKDLSNELRKRLIGPVQGDNLLEMVAGPYARLLRANPRLFAVAMAFAILVYAVIIYAVFLN